MTALERALALAQCRVSIPNIIFASADPSQYVDGVLLQASLQPPIPTLSNIGVSVSSIFYAPQSGSEVILEPPEGVEIIRLSPRETLTVRMLRDRIERNVGMFEARQLRKGG